ncbi:hypothetical protein QTP88_005484 [Uroleucon formosanum]
MPNWEQKTFRTTIGNHSMHDITSDNGLRLIDFASGGGLVVKSTMFPRKDIYKGTWKASNGRYTNQIDHVMINIRFKNCIQAVKTVRGADCDSDHYLVKGKLNVKLKKLGVRKGTMVDRYEVNKFKDKTVCKWEAIKETLKVVTDTTIGKQKKVKKPWFNTSCEEALNRRKEARLQWINDPTNREKESTYKERQKEASNIFRFEKRKYTKDILWEAETNHRVNKTRELYQKINAIRSGKAYDSIHRESLLNILIDFKFPRKIINFIGASLNHTDIQVKIGNVTSQPTRVTTGLRQGDALSSVLFNLVLERVIREINILEGVILGQIRIGMLAYADDIAHLGEDLDMIKKLGKYLVASRRNRNGGLEQYIKIEELKFKRVSQFKYLGSMITEDNDIKTEVSTRMQLANRGYYGLEKVLKSKALSKALKTKMYMTLLRPIVLYGSETWGALREIEESRLMIFERKVLRKIFGPIYDRQTNEWRKLHNVELQGLFQRPNIVREIAKRKLSWAGHAWHKQGTLVKWVIEKEPNGKRPPGRPKLRWEDGVKKEVEKIEPGVKWREVAEDRRIVGKVLCFQDGLKGRN